MRKSEMKTFMPLLNWDVLVTPGIPYATNDLLPGHESAKFLGNSVYPNSWQAKIAVAVDAFMTVKHMFASRFNSASGKNL